MNEHEWSVTFWSVTLCHILLLMIPSGRAILFCFFVHIIESWPEFHYTNMVESGLHRGSDLIVGWVGCVPICDLNAGQLGLKPFNRFSFFRTFSDMPKIREIWEISSKKYDIYVSYVSWFVWSLEMVGSPLDWRRNTWNCRLGTGSRKLHLERTVKAVDLQMSYPSGVKG